MAMSALRTCLAAIASPVGSVSPNVRKKTAQVPGREAPSCAKRKAPCGTAIATSVDAVPSGME